MAHTSPLRRAMTRAARLFSHPVAFVGVGVYLVFWWFLDRESFDWHGMATVLTLLMTFLITRAEHRDTAALHAKMDALIKATDGAPEEVTAIDEREVEEIEEQRQGGQ